MQQLVAQQREVLHSHARPSPSQRLQILSHLAALPPKPATGALLPAPAAARRGEQPPLPSSSPSSSPSLLLLLPPPGKLLLLLPSMGAEVVARTSGHRRRGLSLIQLG